MTDASSDCGEDRFAANLAALKEWAPQLQSQLRRLGQPHSELAVGPTGSLDITFMGQGFYQGDAATYADKQVEAFFQNPVRRILSEPDPESLTGGIGDFCVRVVKRLDEAGIAYDPDQHPEDSHFMVVFGVGLGLHLPSLIERSGCKCLVLIEPTLENLYHSMRVLDWAALLGDAKQRDMKVIFITDRDPTSIAFKAFSAVRANNPILFDGLYLYSHYPSAILQQAKDSLQRELFTAIRGLGFFEDELKMTGNTVDNISRPEVHFVNQPMAERQEPLFVVGSGPSLEQEIPFLRANQERVVIMSIGTALRVLLSQGIRPDFHVELENNDANAHSIEATAKEFDTKGVALVASTSVRRRLADCFERVIFFLRESVTGTYLLGSPVRILSPSGPTVANTALMAALRFGFRKLYLFGVDMGSREDDHFHAEGSVFSTGIMPEFRETDSRFGANFGGLAWGDSVLNWSRQNLEIMLRAFSGIEVYNCSDGVRIEGAIPKVSRAIELPEAPLDRERFLAELDRGLAHLPGERLAAGCRPRFAELQDGEVFRSILAVFEAALAESDLNEKRWILDVFDILADEAQAHSVGAAFIRGSMITILGCANWYDRRVVDPERRDACRRIFLEEAKVAILNFDARLQVLLEEVEAKLSSAELPQAAVGD